MDSTKLKNLELFYSGEKYTDLDYSNTTTVNELKNKLSTKFNLNINEIKLTYNKTELIDDSILLENHFPSSIPKLQGEKIRIKIIPQIHLSNILKKITLCQLGNDSILFEYEFDILLTRPSNLKDKLFKFFRDKFEEYHYIIEGVEFFDNPTNENLFFNHAEEKTLSLYLKEVEDFKFHFLMKNSSIYFYKNQPMSISNNQINEDNSLTPQQSVELRKEVSTGVYFPIIIQTYNSVVKELMIKSEMTISDLKKLIQEYFMVKPRYQELIYLVYKLKDENKKVKDYYIRPQGVIFLRGHYFHLIFADFYNKSMRNILGVNISEQISFIKMELIDRLKLGFDSFQLVCNGKELSDEKNLIDYDIQKLQVIYLK
jgi:hypothetical protein